MKLLVVGFFVIVSAQAQIPYPDVVLADQPAAYWRMGEPPGSPYAVDDSGHAERAVGQGRVFFGQVGALQHSLNTSVELTGIGYFLTPLIQTAITQYSLEAWVNTSATLAPILQDRGYDVNQPGSPSITMSVGIPDFSDGAVHCGADGDGFYIGDMTQLMVNDGLWHHLVCVFSGIAGQPASPSQFQIYVDGRSQPLLVHSVGTRPVAPLTGHDGTTIGIHPIWQQQFGLPNYVGLLDEVAVYRYALSPGQVLAHYLAGECPLLCE